MFVDDDNLRLAVVREGSAETQQSRLAASLLRVSFVSIMWLFAVGAQAQIPPAVSLPQQLSLPAALDIFHRHGLDLLLADAAIREAEGEVIVAGALANPVVSAGVGNAFTYADTPFGRADCLKSGARCTPWSYNVGISESGALVDALSGKRNLRLRVARNALAAAKLSRRDAERVISFQVKSTYLQVAQAAIAQRFALEIAASEAVTLNKFRDRYRSGAINEGDLQRIEVEKLEADQAFDVASKTLRSARVALAFLLGVRGAVPDFNVDAGVLDFSEPTELHDATEVSLLRLAFDHRPDLLSLGYLKASAEAQLKLIDRELIPNIQLGLSYSGGGFGGLSTNGPLQGQTLTLSVSAPFPVLYNLEGERRQASAQRDTNRLREAQLAAQVVEDVASAYASYVTSKRLVQRMEGARREDGGLIESAKGAFEIAAVQYEKGAATLTDYLDALRSYISTKNEYFGDVTDYWTAVFQLEAAIAKDLR